MKFFFLIILLILLSNCSFDDKTGIWKNEQNKLSVKKDNSVFKDFQNLNLSHNRNFNQIIEPEKNLNLFLESKKTIENWKDQFFSNGNVYPNFRYDKNNNTIKGKKLSRSKLNQNIFFINNLLITSNFRGDLIVYSVTKKKILNKYNFYKKKFRNIEKKLNIILFKDNLYISDNIGFLYAYNYNSNKIIWAKKFPAPFRSNIKINNNKLYIANENNSLFVINVNDGSIIRKIPTEEVLIKNKFISNLSLSDKNVFYLNTFGTLYSINQENLRLNWFKNINPTFGGSFNDLFSAQEIKTFQNNLIILSDRSLQIMDNLNGSTKYIIPIHSKLSPIVNNNYIFMVSKNNLLIALEINTGKIVYSFNIDKKVADYLNKIKKEQIDIKFIQLINSKIFLFLNNSYIIEFNINGEIEDLYKLPSKMVSNPIFVNNSILYLSKNKKLITLN